MPQCHGKFRTVHVFIELRWKFSQYNNNVASGDRRPGLKNNRNETCGLHEYGFSRRATLDKLGVWLSELQHCQCARPQVRFFLNAPKTNNNHVIPLCGWGSFFLSISPRQIYVLDCTVISVLFKNTVDILWVVRVYADIFRDPRTFRKISYFIDKLPLMTDIGETLAKYKMFYCCRLNVWFLINLIRIFRSFNFVHNE